MSKKKTATIEIIDERAIRVKLFNGERKMVLVEDSILPPGYMKALLSHLAKFMDSTIILAMSMHDDITTGRSEKINSKKIH